MKNVKIFLVIILIIPGMACYYRKLYVSFNSDIRFYKVYVNKNFKVYYNLSLDKEFLNEFSSMSIAAIKVYENLNGTSGTKNYLNFYTAIVKETCGVGCGKIGEPGIEIQERKFEKIYRSYTKYKRFDSLIFYELARNFWFYDKQLTCSNQIITESMRTGFAVFMRNICIEKLGIQSDSINGLPYSEYLKGLKSIYDHYSMDSTLDIEKAMFDGKLPVLPSGFTVTSASFWASVLYHLYDKPGFGDQWLNRVWHEVSLMPKAENESDVLNNFYTACCNASGKNLRAVFLNDLKWVFKD